MKLRRTIKSVVGAAFLVAIAAAGYVGWIVAGPGPTDFAGSDKVPLGEYAKGRPTGVPASLADATVIDRGHYLARAADCLACHSAPNGKDFAGGRAFVLPFGTLYSTNITADVETGIGKYSDADFMNAVRRGIRHDGARLYPAMPFVSYQTMTDEDVLAIKAYLFSLPTEHAPRATNTLWFPFDQRALLASWSMLFNRDRRFEPHAERSVEWNRGAYLVGTLAHCAECHTPRTIMQSLDHRLEFGGAVQAGWNAYNISSDKTAGIGDWSDETLVRYLSQGHAPGVGGAAGPMREAVELSLQHLDPADIAAMVTYLKTVPAVGDPSLPAVRTSTASASPREGATDDRLVKGKALYAAACASCHGWSGTSPLAGTATLTGVRSINEPAGINVAQVVISGVATGDAMPMPAFGAKLTDDEVALVANYVTARFGVAGSTLTAAAVAKLRKQGAAE
ncbi:cytochrome c [soil metagenome]